MHRQTDRSRARRLWLLVALSAMAAMPGPPLAADLAVEGLQRWLDETRDLEARFQQTLLSGALGAGLSESGTLYLARPGRMRWEYRDPERKTALIVGGTMQLYLAEEEQMIVSEIPEESDMLPTLLAGEGRLVELFRTEPLEPERGAPRLRLLPAGSGEAFEEVVLTLDRRGYAITRAVVIDGAGNETEYRFSSFRRNRGLPDGAFSFTPPPGTEIVRH